MKTSPWAAVLSLANPWKQLIISANQPDRLLIVDSVPHGQKYTKGRRFSSMRTVGEPLTLRKRTVLGVYNCTLVHHVVNVTSIVHFSSFPGVRTIYKMWVIFF